MAIELVGTTTLAGSSTGDLLSVADLAERERLPTVLVCDLTTLRLRPMPLLRVQAQGMRPVVRLTTALGRRLELTPDTPLYTYDGPQLPLGLVRRTRIAVPRRLPVSGSTVWPEPALTVLAYLVARGTLTDGSSVRFYTSDPQHRDHFLWAAEQWAGVRCALLRSAGGWVVRVQRRERTQPSALEAWLQELGLAGQSTQARRLPGVVFTFSPPCLAPFLARLWEVERQVARARRQETHLAFSSAILAGQVQHLFLRLGILAQLTVPPARYAGDPLHQVRIGGRANLATLAAHLGPHLLNPAQHQALVELAATAPESSGGWKDVLPLEIKGLVRAARDARGLSWEALAQQSGAHTAEFASPAPIAKRGYTRTNLQRLADTLDDAALRRYTESDLYWDEVITIEDIGEQPVYQVEVAADHSLVAADILLPA